MTVPKVLTINGKNYILQKVFDNTMSAHEHALGESMDGNECLVLSIIPIYVRDEPYEVKHGFYVKTDLIVSTRPRKKPKSPWDPTGKPKPWMQRIYTRIRKKDDPIPQWEKKKSEYQGDL